MNRDEFREALLRVMEQKRHWAWPAFEAGRVPRELLHLHLEQEYGTYVRDFPVLVGRAYVQCGIAEVRQELVENMYEEETGGLIAGRPHPELFLLYPSGMGMDLSRFHDVELLPASRRYREALDRWTVGAGWEPAAAVATLFLEGTAYERGELDATAPRRPAPPLTQHPLVRHYGLPLEALALVKAHRQVEGDHRQAAWKVVLDHTPEVRRDVVLTAMSDVLQHWLDYRDGVAAACGLSPEEPEAPRDSASAGH